jgi:hypothetical protein
MYAIKIFTLIALSISTLFSADVVNIPRMSMELL